MVGTPSLKVEGPKAPWRIRTNIVSVYHREDTDMPRQVLITGAAGVIGQYVAAELLRCGYKVIGLDNYSRYGEVATSFDDDSAYVRVRGDAKDVDLLSGLLRDCDHFIAGAAMVGGVGYVHDLPYDLLAENHRITAAACDAAIDASQFGVLRKVTYLSCSSVYENTNVFPSQEGDERRMPPPSSSYGYQKLAVEYFARAAWNQQRLPYTIVRPFSCVGVGELPSPWKTTWRMEENILLARSHVVTDLIERILNGESPLRILGDGNQVRHYTYGGDLARGIVLAMESDVAFNQVFNISTSVPTTIRELATMIWRKIRGDEPLSFETLPGFEHDVQFRIPDVGKAERLLSFQATTPLDQAIDQVIKWTRNPGRSRSVNVDE